MKHCWRSILYCAVLNEHCSYTPSANAIIINMLWVTISMKSSEIKNALTTKRKGSVLYIFNFPLCIRIVALSCSYFHNFMEFMFVDNVTFLRVSLVCWKICWCRYMTDFDTRASILNWIDQKKTFLISTNLKPHRFPPKIHHSLNEIVDSSDPMHPSQFVVAEK